MNLGSMAASRYITPFRAEVEVWVNKFSTVSEQLEIWIQVQGMWMYLEAVFTSGDIAKQLPQESKLHSLWLHLLRLSSLWLYYTGTHYGCTHCGYSRLAVARQAHCGYTTVGEQALPEHRQELGESDDQSL